ncbi:MAG: hypothetical protein MI919_40665 [Holophagales bacterium]|nr:hypothetical protein [Holophagales bacterium]
MPWALGQAQVRLEVTADSSTVAGGGIGGPSARVDAELRLRVLEDGWTQVPLLPAGTAVDTVTVDGEAVQLEPSAEGLAWSVRSQGSYAVRLGYRADAQISADGYALALPLPRASSLQLDAVLPEPGLDVAVIPSAGRRVRTEGGRTWVNAALPATQGVLLTWRRGTERGFTLSRADYRGRLEGGALRFEGRFEVEVFAGGAHTLALLPSAVTLSRLEVDGEPAPILVESNRFATLVEGRGRHTLLAAFEVPVAAGDGPPNARIPLPAVPVSALELELPGKKEISVEPASSVETRFRDGLTLASARVPMADSIHVRWTEAVPENLEAELRAHGGLYHAFWAEEGVLFARAVAEVEITRGATSTLRLEVPEGVQIDEVSAEGVGVQDWRLAEPVRGGYRELAVFLDRQLDGRLLLDLGYDRSLESASRADSARPGLELPLLRLADAQRQRGMVAFLQGRERVLEPAPDDGESVAAGSPASGVAAGAAENADAWLPEGVTRVGENQLPAFVRERIRQLDGTAVAHTFKYVETPKSLRARASIPERQQGRFDVLVDTLISLAEVTLEASVTVEVDVKSGSVSSLTLELPADSHLLGLSGPSVRQHTVADRGDGPGQRVDIAFTQEMEGQFRLDLGYERILDDGADRVPVPVIAVPDAEVEQGRLAVEALSAVEVQPAAVEQLSTVDVAELPRSLILRTTNPILHAYKYVGEGRRLELRLTRHRVVDVQEAAIDLATYRTLYTRDGLAVTHARFDVRNSREQFLRVLLPEGSKVWSAFVDGKPEKPARASGSPDEESGTGESASTTETGEEILLRILHSTRGFPVELVYETPAGPIRGLGKVRGELPRPAILVTRSRWEVWVPDGITYRRPGGEMELVAGRSTEEENARALAELGDAMAPLRLEVPRDGVRFVFEKLYANRVEGEVGFELPYTTGLGELWGEAGLAFGTLIAWGGLALFWRGRRRGGAALAASGIAVLTLLVLGFHLHPGTVVLTSLLIAVILTVATAWRHRHRFRPAAVEPAEG